MTAYGRWLPNDPRGSTSTFTATDIIAELGELHFGRKKIQPCGREIREFYRRAADVLKHPPLEFDQRARDCIAKAFAQCVRECRYTCYALAILYDHIHILIRKHRDAAEQMMWNLQRISAELRRSRALRASDHPVWATSGWKVFLDEPDDIWRTISDIQRNHSKHRLADQHHPFVAPYDGWPLRNATSRG